MNCGGMNTNMLNKNNTKDVEENSENLIDKIKKEFKERSNILNIEYDGKILVIQSHFLMDKDREFLNKIGFKFITGTTSKSDGSSIAYFKIKNINLDSTLSRKITED
jgi:ABC-type transport system involved in Fe-S cluster assembly fused permease/ATPase subunit